MTRPSKVDNQLLLERLQAGISNPEACIEFNVSREAIRQHRVRFIKEGKLSPDAQTTPRWRGRKPGAKALARKIGETRTTPRPRPSYELRDGIRQMVKEEVTRLFQALMSIDDLTKERDFYKERSQIAEKAFSKITQSQKEYELLTKQGVIGAPLTHNPSNFTEHIDCKTQESETDLAFQHNIMLEGFLFLPQHNIITELSKN